MKKIPLTVNFRLTQKLVTSKHALWFIFIDDVTVMTPSLWKVLDKEIKRDNRYYWNNVQTRPLTLAIPLPKS